ncbi:MAG: sensor histidine kinase [Alphaproteobacteria bacterium]|nr:sensor histidine kinase [Alphaproteobacteria bacterium]MBU0804087.1 sensor histidine kinase [Alphaproteobacteria bacterium]MBU0872616.1 sensor histidine kinase [Alphaproteobacteria bacterium]MBU1403628.1 sensor histidine kinase [Alphaproteobacteria bacterium]MBU1593655.1 sensor histidine kinase [Alphaproteobacteria bacterium]
MSKAENGAATGRSNPAASAPITVRSAVLLILAFFVVFAAFIALWLTQAHEAARMRGEDRVAAASQVVATNALWISEVARQALRRIDDTVGPSLQPRSGKVQDIREAVDSLPGQVKAYVVDAKGDTIYSTDPEVKPINITDRDYFAVLAAGKSSYLSGLMVSRLNDKQIFVFSRRLVRDGKFAGAAIISFDVALLASVWASLDLGANSTISLVRDDGMLVARYPLADKPLDMSNYTLFTDHLKQAPTGTYSGPSPIDGVERLVSFRTVPGTRFIALASIDEREAMALFWNNALITLLLALPTALGLAAASLWITQLLQRDATRRRELATALESNKLLLREIHHRVKNNLQSIQSLVRLQNIPDDAKTDLRGRIAAMASVHEHIYSFDQFADVEASEMLRSVIKALVETYAKDVDVDYGLQSMVVDHDQATPLALVANEIVTNSLKYAFADRRKGKISIRLEPIGDGRARLVIADNGVGFDADAVRTGMGSKLIKGVVDQLDGNFAYDFASGTTFTLEFALHSRNAR